MLGSRHCHLGTCLTALHNRASGCEQAAGEAPDAGNELAAVLAAMQRLMLDPAACSLQPSLQVWPDQHAASQHPHLPVVRQDCNLMPMLHAGACCHGWHAQQAFPVRQHNAGSKACWQTAIITNCGAANW